MAEAVLVMITKAPVPGRVKTRLTRDGSYSAADAAALHAACIRDATAHWWRPERWTLAVVHPPGEPGDALAELVPAGVVVAREPQLTRAGRDFGAVMHDVQADWHAGGAAKVGIVGSDVPHLPLQWLIDGFDRLEDHDLVLGPDEGGGFYFIGSRRPLDLLCAAAPEGPIVWSRGIDGEEVVRRAERRGLRTALLPVLYDLDEPPDVARLWRELKQSAPERVWLPSVRAVLASFDGRRR